MKANLFSKFNLSNSWLAMWIFLLYLPILVMILFSFNDSKRGVVWRGFSMRHYEDALQNDSLREAFFNSLLVAVSNAALATILGLGAALALCRLHLPFVRLHTALILVPLVIPEICLGIALLVFFHAIGWPFDIQWPWSLGTVLVAHVALSIPFSALIIIANIRQINPELELAAQDLGASKLYAIYSVLIPRLKPALFASALICFTLSLDDFIITFFTAGPSAQLLPVKVFSMVRFGATPQVNAASTILIIVTCIAVFSAIAYSRKRQN